jgi:predicted metal-dependent peptidase
MNAEMMILRAKVRLQNENPFFAYLVMNLTFRENKDVESIGISIKDKGLVCYNPTWIESLREEELRGVLAHEVLHLVLEHLTNLREKDVLLWNIATDLCINYMLVENNFELTKGLVPQKSWGNEGYTFDFKGVMKIVNIENKTAEQIYSEIINNPKIQKIKQEMDDLRGDEHEYSDGDKALTKEEIAESKDKWKNAVGEAVTHARQKGNLPKGLELFVDKLQNAKINWKQMLYKYITRVIPFDYTYARPSKRSISSGFYMPSILKETIEMVVSIDTSGSISQKQLSDFLSEITGIAKSFNNLKMSLIVCDSEIKDVYHVGNGDSDRISKLKIRGGGGTSHIPIYDYVKAKLPNTKLLINFTDGYTDFPTKESVKTLWVLSENNNKSNIPFGEVIELK